MPQTAIEYIIEQIANGKIKSTYTKCGYLIEVYDDVIEIAKQIEKEQILNAWDDCYSNCIDKVFCNGELKIKNSLQYYNEIYK